jgi:hypothetical protein
MRRKVFNFVSAASLLLFLVSVGLWVRSYWVGDGWQLARLTRPADHWYSAKLIRFGRGCCIINWDHGMWVTGRSVPLLSYCPDDVPLSSPDTSSPMASLWVHNWWNRRGFDIEWGVTQHGSQGLISVVFPLWLPAALFAMLPSIWILKNRRKRTRDSCRTCGYNLSGNVSGICPECGTAMAGKVGK